MKNTFAAVTLAVSAKIVMTAFVFCVFSPQEKSA